MTVSRNYIKLCDLCMSTLEVYLTQFGKDMEAIQSITKSQLQGVAPGQNFDTLIDFDQIVSQIVGGEVMLLNFLVACSFIPFWTYGFVNQIISVEKV